MSKNPFTSIDQHFSNLEDPRKEHLNHHPLINILVIALCAVVAGADNWTEIEDFGKQKRNWLSQFLDLSNGLPSHDTFGRVFARLDPNQFQIGFLSWVQTVFDITKGQVINVDGKLLHGSHDNINGKSIINMVSAWATANHLVLGQVKVRTKSNEITAIAQLLAMLEIAGCIVTIDGIGTQEKIVSQIVKQKADYLLPVKENQQNLFDDIALFFRLAEQKAYENLEVTHHRTVDNQHGRMEIRECWAISGEESLAFMRNIGRWDGLETIIMIKSERQFEKKTEKSTRYFITSLKNDAKHLLDVKRSHWGIENGLHWVLDVAFREDVSRIRQGFASENMATLRHMAVNLLKQDRRVKGGIHAKRMRAAWNEDYLFKLVSS